VPTQRTESGEVIPAGPYESGLRRSIYLQQRRTQVASVLEVFDAPSIVTTCTRRLPSTVPLQSLSLLNSAFMVWCADRFARRLEQEIPQENHSGRRIGLAFLLTTGRLPDDRERLAALRFLETQPSRYLQLSRSAVRHRVWTDFSQMVLASNAFLYVE
jgi:hypothetical protein